MSVWEGELWLFIFATFPISHPSSISSLTNFYEGEEKNIIIWYIIFIGWLRGRPKNKDNIQMVSQWISYFCIFCSFRRVFFFSFFFLFFWLHPRHVEVPGPGIEPMPPPPSCDLYHSCGNTRSLAYCTTRELPIFSFLKILSFDFISSMFCLLARVINSIQVWFFCFFCPD